MRGTNRIAVDPFGFDLFPAPSFDRVVDPDHQFAAWRKSGNQQAQQDAAHRQGRPASPIQDPVVVDETFLLAQPHDPQTSGHSSSAKLQDCSGHQDFGMFPNRIGEQGRKFYNLRQQLGRQCLQFEDLSWKKWSSTYAVCSCFFRDQKWTKLSLAVPAVIML
jgi:hypothetical protein